MLRHLICGMSAGLLLSTLAVALFLPAKRATASDGSADRAENMEHRPSAKDAPTVPEPHVRSMVKLKDICRVREEGQNIFTKDGKLTLALCKARAGYRAAQDAAESINSQLSFYSGGTTLAKALDGSSIEVTVAAPYREDPVAFIAQVLSLPMIAPELDAQIAITVEPLLPGKPATASGGSADPTGTREHRLSAKGSSTAREPDRRGRIMLKDICRVRGEGQNIFTKDGKLTLALHNDRADYEMTHDATDLINSQLGFQSAGTTLAKALDGTHIEVNVPAPYGDDPVAFISQVLSLPMIAPEPDDRMAIDEGTNSIGVRGGKKSSHQR